MTRSNEYRAYFTLVGDFDPDAITSHMNLAPSIAWKKGSLSELTQLERKFSRWSLDSRLSSQAPLEAHVSDVLKQLRPVAEKIVEIRKNFDGALQLVGYFHRNYPGLSFNAQMLSELGSLNLGLDFDFYYLYSDKREDS